MSCTINASTSAGLVSSADLTGQLDFQSNGTTKLSVLSTGVSGTLTSGTAVASTSGTSIDFTSIPSWVKRITVMFNGVSLSGTSNIQMQIGTGGTPTTTGYVAQVGSIASGAAVTASTTGFPTAMGGSAFTMNGSVVISNQTGNSWVASGTLGNSTSTVYINYIAGSVTLSGVLNILRITTTSGTDTFDAGSINIQYEG